MPTSPTEGRSRAWYWIGGAMVGIGIIAGVALVVDAVGETLDALELQRVRAPGEGVVALEEGGWTIYWEPATPPAGDDIPVPPFEVEVEPVGGGGALDTDPYRGDLTVSDRSQAALTFHAPSAGRYRLRSFGFPPGVTGTLAVGRGFGVEVGKLLLGIGGGLAGTLGGGLVIMFTALNRSAARRKERRRLGPYPAPPPPPPAPPAAAPPASAPPPPPPAPPPRPAAQA